jgi:hypothetical protein
VEKTNGSLYGPSLGYKADVLEVSTVVLKFSPGLFGLYGVFQFDLDVFCELHSETSKELQSMIENTYFRHATENGLTVLPENSQTR